MRTFADVFINEIQALGHEFLISETRGGPVERFWELSIAIQRHYQAWFKIKHRDCRYPHMVADRWDGPEAL
jgi:hypothetical protein